MKVENWHYDIYANLQYRTTPCESRQSASRFDVFTLKLLADCKCGYQIQQQKLMMLFYFVCVEKCV